jgi:BMFP domain-containing protein YqiC
MNCLESQEQIQRYLDGELADTGQGDFAAHLLLCPDCREQYGAAQCLLEGLRLLPQSRPPAGLGKRICRQIMVECGRAKRLRRLVIASTVAASLLLASWVGYRTRPPAASPAVSAVAERRPLGSGFPPQNRSLTVAAQQLPHPAERDQVEKALSQALQRSAQSLQVIQHEMFASLEPVTVSARQALNFFLQGISPLEKSVQ